MFRATLTLEKLVFAADFKQLQPPLSLFVLKVFCLNMYLCMCMCVLQMG